jgi:hypothetical protein
MRDTLECRDYTYIKHLILLMTGGIAKNIGPVYQ